MSKHHDVVLHHLQESIRQTIFSAHRFGGPMAVEVDSMYYGLGLVVCQGFLERELDKFHEAPEPDKMPARMPAFTAKPSIAIIDFWHYKFDKDGEWYGWDELTNVYRLRHCFAPENGFSAGHIAKIKSFHKAMNAGKVKDRTGKTLRPYFDLNGDKPPLLHMQAVERFTVLTGELIRCAEKTVS